MSHKFSVSATFLSADTKLTPRDSAAAIIINEKNEVLLQLRDDKPDIFFPNHWGCFGGAIDLGERLEQTLAREVMEELNIAVTPECITRFIDIGFTPKPGAKDIVRHYFVVRMNAEMLRTLQLGEGSDCRFFAASEALSLPNGTPYDKFALWIYFNQERL